MTHTITLEVPEEIYEPLLRTAKETGRTPEELASRWLVIAIGNAVNDPLERFIGAFPSDTPDWLDRHDHYIGQESLDQIKLPENDNNA